MFYLLSHEVNLRQQKNHCTNAHKKAQFVNSEKKKIPKG